jgi:SAM-dependent methyltransferase
MIGDTEGKIVVDVGAGKGWTVSRLKGTKIALDLALQYLKSGRFGDSHLVEAAAECIPFDRCADVVICDSVLEHVLDPHRVIEEMRRILKEDGRVFVSVPYREDLSPYLKMSSTYSYTHLRSFDLDAIKRLLLGFTIEEVRMVHLKRYPFLIRFVLRQVKLRFRPLYRVIRESRICVYVVLSIDSLFCRFSKSYCVLVKARISRT